MPQQLKVNKKGNAHNIEVICKTLFLRNILFFTKYIPLYILIYLKRVIGLLKDIRPFCRVTYTLHIFTPFKYHKTAAISLGEYPKFKPPFRYYL